MIENLESKLTAILSSILEAKLRVYEESMTFFNTSFETMKVKMDSLEKQTKTLAQENNRLRSDSVKMNKEIIAIYVPPSMIKPNTRNVNVSQ